MQDKSTYVEVLIMKRISVILLIFSTVIIPTVMAQDNVITFEVGLAKVTLLSEGQRTSGTNVLVGATEEMIKQAIPNGTYPGATNVFLVEIAGKAVLIDAGLGKKTIENLEFYGKKAAEIDAIFITHLHGDHIGSLILNDVKSYPKAMLYISKPEYDSYMENANMRKLFDTYKDQIYTFMPGEIDNAKELIPGLKAIAAYGHTPGHTGFLLESDDSKLLFWGDLTHAMAIQMPFPEVAMTYDSDKAKAIETRQKLLNYLSDDYIRIAGAHIQYPGIGYLSKRVDNGYDFTLLCGCEGVYPDVK